METIDKIDKKELLKDQQIHTMFSTIFASTSYDWEFTDAEITKMMIDDDVKSAIDQRKRRVRSRTLTIAGEGNIQEGLKEQLNDLNTNNIIDVIIDSKFRRHTVQEIIYNNDLTMKEIKEKPNEWYIQQWNDTLQRYEWVLWYNGANTGVNLGEKLPYGKYLIPINRPTDIFIGGRSELEPIYKWWKIKNNSLEHANTIVEKYGGIITWFLYNQSMTSTELDTAVENIKTLTDDSVISIPEKPGGQAQGLDHEFGFISMDKLTNDLHMRLLEFCQGQISQYLIGSSITMTAGESGSYSSANVGMELLDAVVEDDVSYVEQWLNVLVKYQSIIFGFDAKEYKVTLEEKEDPEKKQDLNKKRIDNYKGLNDIGLKVSKAYVSQTTGIPEEELEEVEVQQFVPNQNQEFEKKKTLGDIKARDIQIDKEIQKVMQKKATIVTKQLSDMYYEKYKKIENESDMQGITIDYSSSNLDEDLLLFELFGVYSQAYRDVIEFEEDYTIEQLFDLPFQEAIKYFTEKVPRLYEEIEELTTETAQKVFWIKRATDIETVQKMQKALQKTLDIGGTFKEFKKDIKNQLANVGIAEDGWYLDVVYRTNVMNSYGAGRQDQQEEMKEYYPYWLYNAIEDSRTSDICNALNDKVYKADNPIWNEIYPGNHYRCRSVVTVLDKEQMKELDLKVSRQTKETRDALEKIQKTGFNSTPKEQVETLKKVAEEKGVL